MYVVKWMLYNLVLAPWSDSLTTKSDMFSKENENGETGNLWSVTYRGNFVEWLYPWINGTQYRSTFQRRRQIIWIFWTADDFSSTRYTSHCILQTWDSVRFIMCTWFKIKRMSDHHRRFTSDASLPSLLIFSISRSEISLSYIRSWTIFVSTVRLLSFVCPSHYLEYHLFDLLFLLSRIHRRNVSTSRFSIID